MINEAASFAKNGLIRQLNEKGTWTAAEFSEDGSFLAFCAVSGLHVLETFVPHSDSQKVTNDINNGFLWSKHRRESTTSLLQVEKKEFLVVLDEEFNVLVYALKPSSKREDCLNSPKSSCIQLIPNSIFKNQLNIETETNANEVLLLSATYDDINKKHKITCVANKRDLHEVYFKDGGELIVGEAIPVRLSCSGNVYFKQMDSVVLAASSRGEIVILDIEEKKTLQCFSIIEDFLSEEVHDVHYGEFVKLEIADNLRYIVAVDRNSKFYTIYTRINDELHTKENYSIRNLSELDSSVHRPYAGAAVAPDAVWGDELAAIRLELLEEDTDEGLSCCHAEVNSSYANHSNSSKYQQELKLTKTEIDVPSWTSEFNVEDLLLSNDSIIVHFKSRKSRNEAELPVDSVDSYSAFLLLFDLQTGKSSVQRVQEHAIIARSDSRFFPHCILANDVLYLPTFSTNQEQLFSGFIQYSGISEAEKICRSNQWNQFSIPLHSLEVGLQHRQIDTISFFLKTRDKAFSKYWTSISLPEATEAPRYTMPSELQDDATSVSSMKSHFSSSLAKPVINPSELYKAVDMLIKSIHQNSKGRHKKSFFEALLQMTIDFLNNLIRDGIDVLETIDCHSMPMQILHEQKSKNFTFIVDIPESIAYLVECLKDIRPFITDLPNFYHRKEDRKSPTAEEITAPKSWKAYVEEEILAGRLSHLQEYILKNADSFEFAEVLSGSLSSLVQFGLNLAFRQLLENNLEKSIQTLKNLGKDEKTTLRKIFDHTLDRRLREYLAIEFSKESMLGILNDLDRADIDYMTDIEMLYPCNSVEEASKSKRWLTSTENQKNTQLNCVSLNKRRKKELVDEGSYSEILFKWIQHWDSVSRSKVLLDAAIACKKTENLEKLVSSKDLWEYLMDRNNGKKILEWIRPCVYSEVKRQDINLPDFDPSLINQCSSASSFMKRKVFFEFIKHGIYTDEMVDDFSSILEVISEASTIFGIPDSFIRNVELKSKFYLKFLEYCLKNDLKEVLFLFLDHHSLYPSIEDLNEMNIDLSDFPWFSLMLSLRNLYQNDFGCIDTSLSNAATVFPDSGESTIVQLCREKPLIVLASILTSSLKMEGVLHQHEAKNEFKVDVSSLKHSMMSYELLHSAVFKYLIMDKEIPTSMYNLLQDNTRLNAISFFRWQPGNYPTSRGKNVNVVLPNFSSPTLVNKYGLVIKVTYSYYLKQSRPVYAYLAFLRDNHHTLQEQNDRKKSAFKNAYWIAVENFDSESIVCTCAVFLDFLKIDSWSLKVDIESANYIVKNWKGGSDGKILLRHGKDLKRLIVTCLRRKKKGKKDMLKLLEESFPNTLFEADIERTSFDAIILWRIPMLFSKMNKLTPPVTFIKECAENGKWFHAIIFVQVYQLEPSQVLSCLEKCLKNAILREHLLAVIKNAKVISSGNMEKKIADQKLSKKTGKTNKQAEKDFRAQFYFSLKKGIENRLDNGRDRLSVLSSKKLGSNEEQEKRGKKKPSGNDANADTSESEKNSSHCLDSGKIDNFHASNNVLDVMQECEESGHPYRELMSCAFSLSQPLFVVLAACYQNSDSVDCLCAWLILSFKDEKRFEILSKFNEIKEEKYQWRIESLFIILSHLIDSEDDAAQIISQGFRIFLQESSLLHFFLFFKAFTARKGMDVCTRHINTFAQQLKEEIEEEKEANLIRSFFSQIIPIKILLKCHSKFYQRKLLQFFIDAGFSSFKMSSNFSLEGLSDVCNATENTNIVVDFAELTSEKESVVEEEQQRLYSLLLENGHFEKANKFAISFNLPTWKVALIKINHELEDMKKSTLWENEETRFNFWLKSDDVFRMSEVCCSVAGSFFQTRAKELEDLPYAERALLLSFAFRWFKNETEMFNEDDKPAFLNQLERQIWTFKIKSEIELKSKEEAGMEKSFSTNETRSCSYSSSHLFGRNERTPSVLTYRHSNEVCELIQPENIDFIQTLEDSIAGFNETECKAFESLVGELLEKCEITQARRISAFFGKAVPDLEYVLSSIFLAQGSKKIEKLDPDTASIIAKSPGRTLSISGTYDGSRLFSRSASFVDSANSSGKIMSDWIVIDELQDALEKLSSKCNQGRKCCERVLVCFKIAMMLGMDYSEVVRREPFSLLRELIYSGMDKRRQICRQFIKAFDLPATEVAAFIAEIIIQWLKLNSNFETTTLSINQPNIMIENTFTSEHMVNFIQLVEQPSVLGMLILETAKTISQLEDTEKYANSLQYQVELLIRAHDCFTLACNMEGISEVLRAARMCTFDLVKAQAYSLMVRILTGIGRFKEMTYVFDALAEQHHFELLFRKNIEKEKELKAALLDYIKKNHADDKDKIDMLSKRFGMYREVGEQLEETGHKQISVIKDKLPGNPKGTEPALVEIAKTFSYAADNYLKVGCLRRSQQCRKLARLAELQIRLSISGKCILGLEKQKVNQFLCSHADFYEALAIADAYGFNSATTWVDPLYQMVIVKNDMNYLKQYSSVFQFSGTVMMEIASRYRSDRVSSQMGENLRKILANVKEVKLRYKIAHELNLHDVVKSLLKGPSGAFLRDTVF